MKYKPYGNTGKSLSAIGCGGMRLPDPHQPEAAIALIHAARAIGVTYFDTAPFYCDDQSESIFGEALRTLPPADLPVYVSTKSMHENGGKLREQLESSLTRIGVERISFFHIWCVMDPADWQARVQGGALAAALQAKAEGLIEHVCISTHMNGAELESVLERHPEIEGVTLGYSPMNFAFRQQGLEAAQRLGVGVVAMNPLGGGLIPQHPAVFDFIRAADDPDVVSAALRFLYSTPGLTTALIGFSSLAEVHAAAQAMENVQPHPADHMAAIRQRLQTNFNAMCTGCGYCLPHCPQAIPIPKLMDIHNLMHMQCGADAVRDRFRYHWDLTPAAAAACIQCGACEPHCTQHLPIIERLQQVAAFPL